MDDPEKWMKLAIALLHRYEPGFHTEKRGRPKSDADSALARELLTDFAAIELSELKERSDRERRKAKLSPLSDVAFATHLLKEENQAQLPATYRGKSAATLRKALSRAKTMKSDPIRLEQLRKK